MMSIRKGRMASAILLVVLFAGGCRDGKGHGGHERSCATVQGRGKPEPSVTLDEPTTSQEAKLHEEVEGRESGWLSHHLGMAGGFMLLMMAVMLVAMG